MSKITYLTQEGLEKLQKELEQLRTVERPAVTQMIAEARDKGDLSENAEYDAAKEAQGMLEMRIAKMEDTIAKARIIDESKVNADKVQLLTKVKIRNLATKAIMEYTIVPEGEANLKEGKLSVGTPIAKALLGKKKGEQVEAKVPSGTIVFEIIDISISI